MLQYLSLTCTKAVYGAKLQAAWLLDENIKKIPDLPNLEELFVDEWLDKPMCDDCVNKKLSDKFNDFNIKLTHDITPIILFKSSSSDKRSKSYPRIKVFRRDNFTCQYCLKNQSDEPFMKLTVDHFIPLAFGGSNFMSNLVTACWECHKYKSDILFNSIEEYRDYVFIKRFNKLCIKCEGLCKQSNSIKVVSCPKFKQKLVFKLPDGSDIINWN